MTSNDLGIAGDIISPFPLESLTTKEFAWLHPNSWTEDGGKFWANHRCSRLDSVLKPPPFILKKHQKIKFSRGKWILKTSDRILAWAEIHCFHSGFTKAYLHFDCVHPVQSDQLSLLISAVIINSEPDVLYLCPLSYMSNETSKTLGTFESFTWWLPNSHMWLPPSRIGEALVGLRIIPSTWWALEQGQSDRTTLAYLVKRKEFEKERRQRQEVAKNKPRFRGLFGLFNPWRR